MAGEAERAGMVELLARHVPRSAWAENHRFEVLLRVAKDGGRYLCILNPNVDEAAEDTVRVSAPVNEAVDVWAAGGCAVPVRPVAAGAAIQLRLAPGEATWYTSGCRNGNAKESEPVTTFNQKDRST